MHFYAHVTLIDELPIEVSAHAAPHAHTYTTQRPFVHTALTPVLPPCADPEHHLQRPGGPGARGDAPGAINTQRARGVAAAHGTLGRSLRTRAATCAGHRQHVPLLQEPAHKLRRGADAHLGRAHDVTHAPLWNTSLRRQEQEGLFSCGRRLQFWSFFCTVERSFRAPASQVQQVLGPGRARAVRVCQQQGPQTQRAHARAHTSTAALSCLAAPPATRRLSLAQGCASSILHASQNRGALAAATRSLGRTALPSRVPAL